MQDFVFLTIVFSSDVAQSRQETRTRNQTQPSNKQNNNQSLHNSRPVGIGNELLKDHLRNNGPAMSYTDSREGEFDYLKKIIDQTASNLIDVSSTFAPFDPEDNIDNHDYKEQAEKYQVKQGLLGGLPRSNASNSVETLSKDSIVEMDWLNSITKSCLSAVTTGMKVKPEGPIIVYFPEVSNQ
eukprot:TRINITY_DN7515_c1_g2_i1.p1 TRINITY_DN7515_c1_g2~~TRINITY_DN7515_c1_g2_i1.p1  ORF type:complete len:183 (-),score=43.01 TRINITY_DN7515_c1_g2_i1:108-656(-)